MGVTDLATSKTNSLIYGKFDSDPANQTLTINGKLGVGMAPTYELDVTGDINATGVYNSSGDNGATGSFVAGTCTVTVTGGIVTDLAGTCP